MHFELLTQNSDSKARLGRLNTDHGTIETPIFMPVGTVGSVKGVHQQELRDDINAQIILGNTYHLFLRPGIEVLEAAGGLHQFIGWERPMLTDSGGYQVYSLSGRRKIIEEGVKFQSHLDGSYHFFTPERAIDIQRSIGADIIMAFDECTPYPCDYNYAKRSMHMTHRWLDRCINHLDNLPFKYGYEQTFFPIVQGSTYKDLRAQSAEYIASVGAQGNAIGGLSVGEPAEEMYAMTEVVTAILPEDNDLENVTWESTSKDFEVFKKLLAGWGVIELRLNAITAYKDKNFANELVKQAQVKRKKTAQKNHQLSLVALDYIFMHEVHALIDAELVTIGEKFYLPTLREQWKGTVSDQVLNGKL